MYVDDIRGRLRGEEAGERVSASKSKLLPGFGPRGSECWQSYLQLVDRASVTVIQFMVKG